VGQASLRAGLFARGHPLPLSDSFVLPNLSKGSPCPVKGPLASRKSGQLALRRVCVRYSVVVAAFLRILATSVLPLAAPEPRWPVSFVFRDHRIELAMTQQSLDAGITFTRPSQWTWHVSLDGKQVGTVNGDISCGFTARDTAYRSIGHAYLSVEAAIEACAHLGAAHV
jgi:hypothetical protein